MQANTLGATARAKLHLSTTPGRAARSVASGDHAAWLGIILGLAFTLRLGWVALSEWQPVMGDDAFRYDFTARALLAGEGYVHFNGAPTAFWPPGYSLLLAAVYWLFGDSVLVAQLLNVVLGTATVGLVYLIGRRTLGPKPALVGAAILAGFPSLIFFTAVTLSEVAFTFLALLGVLLLLIETQSGKQRHLPLLLGAGLVIGFASLMRGEALLLPLAFLPFWLRSDMGRTAIAHKLVALALGIGLIVAPWTIRNAVQMESPVVISTNAGVNFWIGHHAGATGGGQLADELIYGIGTADGSPGSPPTMTTVEREVRINSQGTLRGIGYGLTHPLQEISLTFKKLFWLYWHDAEGLRWNEAHGGQPFLSGIERAGLLVLSNVYYLAVLGFFALGVRQWFSLRDPGRLLLISLVGYFTLVHVIFFGDPRFHAPIMPMVAMLTAVPLAVRWSERSPERVRRDRPHVEGTPLPLLSSSQSHWRA